jgi:hypothetical protein
MTEQGHTALFEILVVAVGAVCGEALAALLGVMLSDPRVTWPAITHVLPVAAIYDAVACPFVLYAAAAALRLAGPLSPLRPARARGEARTAPSGAGSGAVRPVGTRSAPRLRLSGGPGENWIGRSRGPGTGGRPAAKREPRLNLGHGWPAGGGLGTAFAASGSLSGPVKVRFAGRRREGVLGGSRRGGSVGGSPYGGHLGSSGLASTRMGRSLLGDSVFSRPSPALARTVSPGRATPLGRSLTPRFSRGKALGRLTGALRRPTRPRSPGRGWLRGTSPRSGALGGRPSSSSALKGSTFKSRSVKGSAFKGSAFRSRSFRSGTFRSGTSLGRGSGAEAWRRGTPRLRSGGVTRLRLPRRKPGGYR